MDAPPGVALRFERYNMGHRRRGRAVIINNENFNYTLTHQRRREGTHVDAMALEEMFIMLGFDVTRYDDLTSLDTSMNLRAGRWAHDTGHVRGVTEHMKASEWKASFFCVFFVCLCHSNSISVLSWW